MTDPVERRDLIITRGDTPKFDLDFNIGLAGADIWFTAKTRAIDTDAEAIIAHDNGLIGGITVLDESAGLARLTIAADSTASLAVPEPPKPLSLHYDVQVKESDDSVTTVASGRLLIYADITRAA